MSKYSKENIPDIIDGVKIKKGTWYYTDLQKGGLSIKVVIKMGTDKKGKPRRLTSTVYSEKDACEYVYYVNGLIPPWKTKKRRSSDKKLLEYHIEDYISYIELRKEERTYNSYESTFRNYITPHIGLYKIEQLTKTVIENYYSKLKLLNSTKKSKKPEKISKQTIIRVLERLRDFVTWLTKQGHYQGMNPIEEFMSENRIFHEKEVLMARQKKILYHDRKEFKQLVTSPVFSIDPYSDFIIFMYSSGLRIGEGCALRVEDIDFNTSTLHVRHSFKFFKPIKGMKTKAKQLGLVNSKDKAYGLSVVKGKKRRDLALSSVALEILKKRCKGKKKKDFIFTHNNTKERRIVLDYMSMEYCSESVYNFRDFSNETGPFKRLQKKAGLDKVLAIHATRHTFAAFYLERNKDIYELSVILGHKSVEVTQDRYGHLLNETLTGKMDIFDI